jgi:Tfp pilus assembly protein PilO
VDRAERQKLILVGLLIVIVAYFGWSGVGAFPGVSGLRAQAFKLQQERDDLQRQVTNAQMMVANLGRIQQEREALEAQLRELSRRLPSEHESPAVLRSVERLAGKSGLTVGAVRRRPSRPQDIYVEIPLEIGVGGSYQELLRFSEELSQLPRLVTLNEVRVRAREQRGERGQRPTGRGVDLTPGSMRAELLAVVFQAVPASGAGTATPAPATGR